MPFAILRMEKRKGGAIRSIEAHNERTKESYKSNPDIQPDKKNDNYHIIKAPRRYNYEVQSRIEQHKCRVRKDSTKMVEALITATPDFMQKLPLHEQREFFDSAVKFMQQEVGEENVFAAVVHMDERTPHMHLCFTPITPDGRLSAKEILGYKDKLSLWQDKFHAHMSANYPELERGISSKTTGRKHIPAWLFKKAKYLDGLSKQIEQALSDITVFNAGKQKDKALDILKKWIPQAQYFTAHASQTEEYVKSLEKKNASLTEKKDKAEEQMDQMELQLCALENTLREQLRLLDKIPTEILNEINASKTKAR